MSEKWQPQPLAPTVLVREQGQYGLIFIEELGDGLDRIVPLDELDSGQGPQTL